MNKNITHRCRNCSSFTNAPKTRGNGWIELILWLCYIIPGLIYSIWRRSIDPNVCPTCNKDMLYELQIKTHKADHTNIEPNKTECPYCAELIQRRAKICKFCNREVELSHVVMDDPEESVCNSEENNNSQKINTGSNHEEPGPKTILIMLKFIDSLSKRHVIAGSIALLFFISVTDRYLLQYETSNQDDSPFFLHHICKAAIASYMGRSPYIIDIERIRGDIIYLSYIRPDDQTKWKYKCKSTGKYAIVGTEDGRWRDQSHDSKIKFSWSNNIMRIDQIHPDGSNSYDLYGLSELEN